MKRWRDFFKVGSHERESFDDLFDTMLEVTAEVTLQTNVGSADVPFIVTHTLKRIPKRFHLTQSASAGILYCTESDRARWTDRQIVLRYNSTGEVKLCVA